jgi:2-haloacid dehalogenase
VRDGADRLDTSAIRASASRVLTLDLFSALIDSRMGGSSFFDRLVGNRSWVVSGEQIYDAWDSANKELHRRITGWSSFRELSVRALGIAYRDLGLTGDARGDATELLASVSDWPTWPDVPEGLAVLAREARVGVLSNVDDDIFLRTRVAHLVDPAVVFTSERLGCYKPSAEIYLKAARHAGAGYVHVAASARDVRGALSAGISTIRVRRPGHWVDPQGPAPEFEVASLVEVSGLLSRLR